MSSTILSATQSATITASPTSSSTSSSSSGPNSPLLFFVALGFGVVFTNLWIIVGVKYCFRYNARNRHRMMGEDPDGVDLGQMPQRRRRREKKLMAIDEVNEKFPLTKYKTWRANRAAEGLPTAGGITSASRPASLRNVSISTTDNIEVSKRDEDKHVGDEKDALKQADAESAAKADAAKHTEVHEVATNETMPTVPPPVVLAHGEPEQTNPRDIHGDHSGEEDDHIESAVPAEQLPDPGDTCAICIDTLEDDDDVRGLSCGHAFHASCVDPWLTSRRACCPLCKADYYVPKPRPDGAEAEDPRRRGTRGEDPSQWTFPRRGPDGAMINGGRRATMILPGRFMSIVYDENSRGFPRVVREPHSTRAERRAQLLAERNGTAQPGTNNLNQIATQPTDDNPSDQAPSWRQRLRMANPLSRRTEVPVPSHGNAEEVAATPSQLEAGQVTR